MPLIKSLNAENMTYRNPIWLRFAIYFGILLFAVFALVFSYYGYRGIENEHIVQVAVFTFGALFFFYMTYLGAGLAKFVKADITLDENGITVAKSGNINKYLWSQIERVKNSKHLQIYTVYDRSNQTVFMVDHMIPGFNEIKSYIENRINI